MKNTRTYKVAGHNFSVSFPEKIDSAKLLDSYNPFRTEGDEPMLFSVDVELGELPYAGELVRMFNDEAPYIWLFKTADGSINFGFSFKTDKPSSIMIFERSKATLHLSAGMRLSEADNAIGNAMMLMFAYNTAQFDSLMIHASVSVKDGKGYVFLGKSGTGKSTHSRLWIENIPEVWLLNDDNPVIRVVDGVATVYGTPWSGKTPCYKNESVPIQAIVRLEQAPENAIRKLNVIEAYAALMPSCSSMKWDREWADAEHRTLEKVIGSVGCWHLRCLPDAAAAKLSYETCSM